MTTPGLPTYPGYETYPGSVVYPDEGQDGYEFAGETFSNPCSGIFADPSWLQEMWIGLPGRMYLLPTPERGYNAPLKRNEVMHNLLSGSVAVTRRARTSRDWELKFPTKSESDAQLIRLLYMGAFGDGPFNFYDPASRNQLSTLTSLSGSVSAMPPDWQQRGSGSLGAAGYSDIPIPGCGAISWSGYAASSTVDFNDMADDVTAVPTEPVPWLEGRLVCFSMFVKGSTPGVSMKVSLFDSSGTGTHVEVASTSFTTTTYWQRVFVIWDMTTGVGADANYPYVVPRLTALGSGASVKLAAPQVEYLRDWATEPSRWVVGTGPAQVVISTELGGSNLYHWFRDYDLKLAEV